MVWASRRMPDSALMKSNLTQSGVILLGALVALSIGQVLISVDAMYKTASPSRPE
jgi:hypothetical protein